MSLIDQHMSLVIYLFYETDEISQQLYQVAEFTEDLNTGLDSLHAKE